MNRILSVWFISLVMATSLQSQDFTNMNFESAQALDYTNGPYKYITTANALPSWSAFSGTNQMAQIQYNPGGAVSPLPVDLLGSNVYTIEGNFSVYLSDGLPDSAGSISQAGLIPSGTQSLLFDADSSSLLVFLGGQSLSYTAISNALNSYGRSYTVYGSDVSGFSGQVETLTFSGGLAGSGGGILDDIRFSPEAVPEPSASLIFLGTGLLFYVRRRKRYRL